MTTGVGRSLCTTAYPLYTVFANIIGTFMSEATMRPNPRRLLRGLPPGPAGQVRPMPPRTQRTRRHHTCSDQHNPAAGQHRRRLSDFQRQVDAHRVFFLLAETEEYAKHTRSGHKRSRDSQYECGVQGSEEGWTGKARTRKEFTGYTCQPPFIFQKA